MISPLKTTINTASAKMLPMSRKSVLNSAFLSQPARLDALEIRFGQEDAKKLSPQEEEFLKAVEDGNKGAAVFYLHQGIDVNLQTEKKHIVLLHRRYQCEKNINYKTEKGDTVLHRAALHGYSELVKALLVHPKINPNLKSKNGFTPLMQTIWLDKSSFNIFNQLLTHPKTDINAENEDGDTALSLAVRVGDMALFQEILKHPQVNINHPNKRGFTPLMQAITEGYLEMADQLLKTPGISVEGSTENGSNALLLAAYGQQRALNNSTVDLEDNPKSGDKAAITPVMIVNQLLQSGKFDLHESNLEGDTPLIESVKRPSKEILEVLLNHPQMNEDGLNGQNIAGKSPLMYAVENTYELGTSQLLAQKGINVHLTDNGGNSALHFAVMAGGLENVKALLNKGAQVNQQNKEGKTPLHLALEYAEDEVAQLLLKKQGYHLDEAEFEEFLKNYKASQKRPSMFASVVRYFKDAIFR